MNIGKQPTMRDVAKLAGVTQATVSYVVNESANVSPEVVSKVQKAIKELGYVPNAFAKGLKKSKSNVVGVIIPDIDIGYFAETIKGVEKNLRENGFVTFLCNTLYDRQLEKEYLNTLIQYNVAGIILGYGFVDKSVCNKIFNLNIPVVALDDRLEIDGNTIFSFENDNIGGCRLAVEHLYNIGAKRICFASEPLYNKALTMRFEGYITAMEQYGYTIDKELTFIEEKQYNKIEMGYSIGAKILLNKNIDAIFASSDDLAIGIVKRLKEHGVKIPDDIAIIGYDDVPQSRLIEPPLTTIAQPKYKMAKEAATLLVKLIKGEEVDRKEYLMEPSLVIRESTLKKGCKLI